MHESPTSDTRRPITASEAEAERRVGGAACLLGSRTVACTAYPRERRSLTSHEAMNPPPPVTHTRRGGGGADADAIMLPRFSASPTCGILYSMSFH